MARNDPYIPDFQTVVDGASATFDGSAGGTGAAIISELSANFDAQIYIEQSTDGGTSWTEITALGDDAGNETFAANWHTQFNRVLVKANVRRVRVDNVDSVSGEVGATGDER